MGIPSNHHLIPRVYLRMWARSGNTIYSIDKKTGEERVHNIEKICNINEYHSIKAGMPCCNDKDLKEIFKILNDYDVIYGNKKLKEYEEYNKYYYDFEEWEIFRKDGNLASKKMLKREIDKVKILEIEDLWNKKYESKWKEMLQMLEQKIQNSTEYKVDEFMKGYLIKFIISMNARGFVGDKSINDIFNMLPLDDIDIPFEERTKAFMDNADKEMKNNILLAEFRDFLNDKGRLYFKAKQYITRVNLQFLIADGEERFFTSDNPSFFYEIKDYHTHIMPVTPQILIRFCKLDERYKYKYDVRKVDDKIVKMYNEAIIDNCYNYYFKK